MIQITCQPTPFVFQPINTLLETIDWRPVLLDDYLTLLLINPVQQKYKANREQSHLTDAQDQENQLRFFAIHEVERKLRNLARKVIPYLKDQKVAFVWPASQTIPAKLLFFIQELNLFSPGIAQLIFKTERTNQPILLKEEELYYSSSATRVKRAEELLAIAKDCMYAGDYWTAINFLLSIRDLPIAKNLAAEVYEKLALSHRVAGDIFEATFYNEATLRTGDFKQRSRAHYSLAMLNLKNYPNNFRQMEVAESNLQSSYAEMKEHDYDPIKKEVEMIFNRNGYALILFRKGKLEEATDMVARGIARLEDIDTSYAKFHQSVLYYNLFQCYQARKDFELAEKTIKHLISIDPKYPYYYIDLANFYHKQSNTEKALAALQKGIDFTVDYYRFHFIKGTFLFAAGDIDGAIAAFEKALELNPSDLGSMAYLTSIYNSLESFARVKVLTRDFEVAYNNNPQGEIIFNNKITAMLQASDLGGSTLLNEMIDAFERINPDSFVLPDLKNMQDLLTAGTSNPYGQTG